MKTTISFVVVAACLLSNSLALAESPLPPGMFPPRMGIAPASPVSLSGEWALGRPDVADFPLSLAPRVNIFETPTGITLSTSRGSYQYSRVPGLPNMFKFSWMSTRTEGTRKTLLIKIDDNTLVEYDTGRFIYLKRVSNSVRSSTALDPTGVWAKGPANSSIFDVDAAPKFQYKRTEFGLEVTNINGQRLIWHKDTFNPNTYVGIQVLDTNQNDITPVGINTWRLTQVSQNKMVLRAKGAEKHLVRVK